MFPLSAQPIINEIQNFYFEKELIFLVPVTLMAIEQIIEFDEDFFVDKDSKLWAAAFAGYVIRRLGSEQYLDEDEGNVKDVEDYFKLEEQEFLSVADNIEFNLINMDFEMVEEHKSIIREAAATAMEMDSFESFMIYEIQIIDGIESEKKEHFIEVFKRIAEELADVYKEDEELKGALIIKIYETGKRLNFLVECYEDDIDLFLNGLEEKYEFTYSIRAIYDGLNLFRPAITLDLWMKAALFMEKHGEGLAEPEVDKRLLAYLEEGKKDPESLDPNFGALQLYLLTKEKSLERSREMMQAFPDYVEPVVVYAGWQLDYEDRLSLLEKAIAIGERKFEELRKRQEIKWWTNACTMPYMRALSLYAHELAQYDYEEDAIEVYWEILELEPADPLVIRFELAMILVHNRDWKNYEKLRSRFRNEDHPIFLYSDFFYNYSKFGKKSRTRKALFKALDLFPEVMSHLIDMEIESDENEYEEQDDFQDFLSTLMLRYIKNQKFVDDLGQYLSQYGVINKDRRTDDYDFILD